MESRIDLRKEAKNVVVVVYRKMRKIYLVILLGMLIRVQAFGWCWKD